MEPLEQFRPALGRLEQNKDSESLQQGGDFDIPGISPESQELENREKEKLIDDRKKQEVMDKENMTKIRESLGIEKGNLGSERIFLTKEGTTDFDSALGELVLEDHPDRIVEQILAHIPEGFLVQDHNLGEVEKKYLQITMTDNGVGIRPENLEKIGNERFTTSRDGERAEGNLHAGGHGRFSFEYTNEIAIPRGWEMKIKNREDGKIGTISSLKIPLMKS